MSIYLVFGIYNKHFNHLEKAKSALRRKKVAWKQLMLLSLEAAEKKLSHYYSMTDEIDNILYAIGTILSQRQKLDLFKGKDWDDPDIDYRTKYRKSPEDYFRPYKKRHSDIQLSSRVRLSAITTISELKIDCGAEDSHPSSSGEYDEIKEYLIVVSHTIYTIGIIHTPVCASWRDHQHQFPALANLARDVLSIPATGAGVERLFNSARDIFHYRRGSLKPSTIPDLIIFMCTSRFEIEDSHRVTRYGLRTLIPPVDPAILC
jgi:hypothetical protein